MRTIDSRRFVDVLLVLCDKYGIERIEDFELFREKYKDKKYEPKTFDADLFYFARKGDQEKVYEAIENGATSFRKACVAAINSGHTRNLPSTSS